MIYPTNERLESPETLLNTAKTEGEQTRITENIRDIAKEIDPDNKLSGVALVQEVCSYVRTILPRTTELSAYYSSNPTEAFDKRERTADQLLSEENLLPNRSRVRNISGCIETAVITRALLLAKDIPCVYTETLMEDWCNEYGKTYNSESPDRPAMQGHVFVDIYDEESGKWYTSDPNDPVRTIHEYGDYTKNGKQYIYPRSVKDSWDLGYKKMKDFQKAVSDFFKSQEQ